MTAVADRLGADVTDDRLCDLAFNVIDIIDRNLYERSCDVRWWATDSAVVDCAADPTPEAVQHATRRLGQILDSYTVYFDLVLASLDGRVLANGRPSVFRQSVGSDVSASVWFASARRTRDSTEFGFETVHASPLAGGDRALVYSCVVREGGNVSGRPLGMLGIVLRWDALGPQTLRQLPLSPAERQRTRSVIVDDDGRVLADDDVTRIGTRLTFDGQSGLFAQARGAVTASVDGASWRICHARSPGFETYATGWHCLVLRRLG